MANWTGYMGIGAGMVGLGYGIYRLSRGQRDWMTAAAISTGLSMTATGLNRRRLAGAQQQGAPIAGSMQKMAQMRDNLMQMAPQGMMNMVSSMFGGMT